MHLYVAGPMTGHPAWNAPAFEAAREVLQTVGYQVTIPGEIVPVDPPAGIPPWEECLRRDLKVLLDCDGVAVLSGWDHSRGASLEVYVANRVGLPVKTVAAWLGPPADADPEKKIPGSS